ncbi:histidine--tRNA ligase [Mycoplasmatota bacterium]|nr:histidine--tRNA ligase [Mycoplasmatota bacterium]
MIMQKPKGTYDVLPRESKKWQYLEDVFRSVCSYYNFKEIRTPIFERTEIFHRSSGEESDIVKKETYTFTDRGKRSMTLRPEGTASTVRAFVENKLYVDSLPQKVYYYGPMFRYERPQAGRYRQFTQFGVEAFGAESPLLDAEVISMAYHIYSILGFDQLVVKVNTLGDQDSRDNYRNALVDYLTPQKEYLCNDCKERIDTNPLRVLDCKIDSFDSPPNMSEYRTEKAQKFFDGMLEYLDALGIPYEVDETLVRGLDYYNHTVFELQATIEGFGSQNTLCGGGRYNGLVKEFGGPDIPGIGFAFGVDRTLLALEAAGIKLSKPEYINCYVATFPETRVEGARLVDALRLSGFITEMSHEEKSLKAQLKQADKMNAEIILILGEEEFNNEEIIVKHQGEQINVKLENIIDYLDSLNLGEINE